LCKRGRPGTCLPAGRGLESWEGRGFRGFRSLKPTCRQAGALKAMEVF